MKIPVKISPCPLVNTVFELKFESNYPAEAVFGILYEALKKDYPNYKKLPISQIPLNLRVKDPNLRYQPDTVLESSGSCYKLLMGHNMIAVVAEKPYPGWGDYKSKCESILKAISNNKDLIHELKRFGLRYVNHFPDENVLSKLNLNIEVRKKSIINQELELIFSETRHDFKVKQIISNSAEVIMQNTKSKGSVIDIDVSTAVFQSNGEMVKTILDTLESAHDIEKELFFESLESSYLESLSPTFKS